MRCDLTEGMNDTVATLLSTQHRACEVTRPVHAGAAPRPGQDSHRCFRLREVCPLGKRSRDEFVASEEIGLLVRGRFASEVSKRRREVDIPHHVGEVESTGDLVAGTRERIAFSGGRPMPRSVATETAASRSTNLRREGALTGRLSGGEAGRRSASPRSGSAPR